jgi:hypothetical protein
MVMIAGNMIVRNLKRKAMKKYIITIIACIIGTFAWIRCTDFPVDEDGLLITARAQCYVSSFQLLGIDYQSVLTTTAVVDTVAQTINATVFYATDLKHLWPQFSLVTDAKLDPKITGFVDFSDQANPKKWTVIAGNRKVRKEYTVYLTVQPKP